ncbi:pectate lyase [Paenibacillus mucilaginosus 3016]|uniref:Pectate lyase n=1 Tax=Paenibacillus mucilaginosus 3016 TaxID=1116391 RepID=H6N8W9_9BACL|nr:pectate lyase [Paenibacillus mucilaginosus]AFC27715.1 pectate lyase [Paenibacillus mucilaginosus 3016]
MFKEWKVLLSCMLIGSLLPGGAAVAGSASTSKEAGADKKSLSPFVQTLPDGVTWAAYDSGGLGVTGGNTAAQENVYVVHNLSELVQALGGDNAANGANGVPKLIFVQGTIDMNVDADNRPLGLEAYAQLAYEEALLAEAAAPTGRTIVKYDEAAYVAAYDPAVYGRKAPAGPLEEARAAAQKKQSANIKINVGSNTTIIGLGKDAKILGGNLVIKSDNVIVRNIEFQDAYDFFPQWDPTDGSSGNWNSQYDSISIIGGTHVWIDHNTFNDGDRPDHTFPLYYGRKFQHHDGAVDITTDSKVKKSSNYITVSYNHFAEHDKTSLIGSSDSATYDANNLRVTMHHNHFEGTDQRVPRVRFGQVHVYNNYYSESTLYAIGVGVSAQVVSEANVFESVSSPVAYYDKAALPGSVSDAGSLYLNSGTPVLKGVPNWVPQKTYAYKLDPAQAVKAKVLAQAGAGRMAPGTEQLREQGQAAFAAARPA